MTRRLKCLLPALALPALIAAARPVAAPLTGAPLYFEANRGQAGGSAFFVARGQDCQFLISPVGAQVALRRAGSANRRNTAAVRDGRRTPALPVNPASAAAPRPGAKLQMRFAGANSRAQISGRDELPGKINYLIGNDPSQWRAGVPLFSEVRVAQLYPGINLTYYGNRRRLEYDFNVAPKADPGKIKIHFIGADGISIGPRGGLILKLGGGEIRQPPPVLYQSVAGARREIAGGYKLLDARTVAFSIGKYDRDVPLVIDPVLSFSTYFGGNSGDTGWAIAVDTNGFIYVAGNTFSAQFPGATGGFQTNYQGGSYAGDAFVAKFDNAGTNLLWLTYLGGKGDDLAAGVAVDGAGHAFLTGYTDSSDFPVTTNALDPKIGGTPVPKLNAYPADAFVAELDSGGSNLVYSTYLGGAGTDAGNAIALDASGDAYVTGLTTSTNFPTTTNAWQKQLACADDLASGNAFVAEIAPLGTNLVYSTYLGGTNFDEGEGIAVDPAGDIYAAGFTGSTNFPTTTNALMRSLDGLTNDFNFAYDAFAAKFAPAGTNLVYATYLGGAADDAAYAVAADAAGNAYVTGFTDSTNFPDTATNTPGLFSYVASNAAGYLVTNVFLTKLSPDGSAVDYSAVFGGEVRDVAYGLAVDPAGNAFVIGASSSVDFPTTGNVGLLSTTNSGGNDAFVTAFNTNASALIYSAYLGGGSEDVGYGIALDSTDNTYLAGQTRSSDFPTFNARQTALAGPGDTFLAKILMTPVPPQITTQPSNQLVETGESATLAVTATGTPPLSYQWQLDGTNLVNGTNTTGAIISGATNATLTIRDAQTNDSGNYAVMVINYGGSVTSSVAVLTVTSAPFLTVQPTNQTVGVGSLVTFSVEGYAVRPDYLQWLKDGTNLINGTNSSGSIISGATNSAALTIRNARTNDNGNYVLVVTNDWGAATSDVATLTVLASPRFTGITAAGGGPGGFILSGAGGTNNGDYFVLTSTNLAMPLARWTPIATNQFGSQGHFLFTNTAPANIPQRFYILQLPSP